MDAKKLAEMLKATLSHDTAQRGPAEEQLNQVHKIIGFVPTLLQIVMQNDLEMPVRQAAAIYLKNIISNNWLEKEANGNAVQIEFSIHEQDRGLVRESIVEAVIHAPDLIRAQLATCVFHIVKCDFPGRWTQIVDKISIYLQNRDYNGWSGSLLCLFQLVKNYEYKKADERTPLTEAMNLLLPMVYQLMVSLMASEQTSQCVLLQKQILRIFHTMTQYCLPLDLITNDVFTQWMEVCRGVIEAPVPDLSQYSEDERLELPWWKAKKWALHIVVRTFERYGSPGHVVNKEYQKFAEWYLPTFTGGILNSLLKVLDQYRNKIYISPRVLTDILCYIKTAVSHAFSWKLIKPHMLAIIQDVVFPIMQYNEADATLWEEDPIQYIQTKLDIYEDGKTPVPAAQSLIHAVCKSRKGILKNAMQFLMTIICNPNTEPAQKDGALHMIGSLADVLLKKKEYREQMEPMLTTYIFPEFNSPHGHMRARACWVIHNFGEVKFKNQQVLIDILRYVTNALLTDKELPVQVEAAIVIQVFLSTQDDAPKFLESEINPITMKLLKIISETENDELTSIMQKIVCTFSEQLLPIAVNVCQELAETFRNILVSEEGTDEKAVTAMGLLNTIETLLTVFDENTNVTAHLQPIVIRVIGDVLQNNMMEFYEEAFSLACDLTSKSISADMWQMLGLIYQVFKKDGIDYFLDLMPALHNYVTVDTPVFLSNQDYVTAIFDMCKSILTNGEAGEDAECHAAKLIEVIILQCKGQIDTCIPSFVELVVDRLMQEVKSSELRTMCLQVLIAALYYNPVLLLQILQTLQGRLQQQLGGEQLSSHFVKRWLDDSDCFLGIHDRKLYVLGMCTAITLGEHKPSVLNEQAENVLPSLLMIFEGLKRAYQSRAQEGEEEESDEEEDDDCEEALSSDEDEVDEFSNSYLENMKNFATKKAQESGIEMSAEVQEGDSDEDSDDDDDDDDYDETTLETYTTPIDDEEAENPIDEYIAFAQVISNLPNQDPQYYALLTGKLNDGQKKGLQELIVTAEQKKAQYASKAIERQGGYAFAQQNVPAVFNFGS